MNPSKNAPAVVFSLLAPLLFFSSCGGAIPQQDSTPVAIQASSAPAPAMLKDADSYDLAITPVTHTIGSKQLSMFGYNGSVPGPVIHVPQGATITLYLKNNMDMPTMLHPHGLRLANPNDGSHLVQKEVLPGEIFTQQLTFPDPGIYWYHPHVREMRQQELGLYGAFIVEPKDPTYWPKVNREEVVILDDILLGEEGLQFSEATDHALMGRYGDTMLVNGKTDWQLQAKSGEVIRMYMLNAANTRTFKLSLPGAELKRVGGDEGAYEKATFEKELLLAPSERVIVDVYFPKAGTFELRHTGTEQYTMGKVVVGMPEASPSYLKEFQALTTNEGMVKEMQEVRQFMDQPVDKTLNLTVDMQGMGGGHGGHDMGGMQMAEPEPIEWEDSMNMMNVMSNNENTRWKFLEPASGMENDKIVWNFAEGDKVKIKIFNDPQSPHPMQHPIHLHGNRMVVLKRNGVPEQNMVWKDTVLVTTGETVEVLADMSNAGKWMIHCHISEHLDNGMMLLYNVTKK